MPGASASDGNGGWNPHAPPLTASETRSKSRAPARLVMIPPTAVIASAIADAWRLGFCPSRVSEAVIATA